MHGHLILDLHIRLAYQEDVDHNFEPLQRRIM